MSRNFGNYTARNVKNIVGRVFAIPLYVVSHAVPRRGDLWLFGNIKGFRDGPRYLATYISESRPEIRALWLAQTEREAGEARRAGLRVVRKGSARGWWATARAGVVVLVNGFHDVHGSLLGGAYVVQLWHGTPLKRILMDVDSSSLIGRGWVGRMITKLRDFSLNLTLGAVRLVVAPGLLAKQRFASAFRMPDDRIAVLGSPRFDVILGGEAKQQACLQSLTVLEELPRNAFVALYLPTWREWPQNDWLPQLSTEVADLLTESDVHLLVKPHPFTAPDSIRERLVRHDRVVLLEDTDIDVNCLLAVSDALITDYSSAAFDYAILGRPILFFAADVDRYSHAGRGLYEPYEQVTGSEHFREWESLIRALNACANGNGERFRHRAEAIAGRYVDIATPENCARVVDYVGGHRRKRL